MIEARVRQALERRYDGPVPPGAAVPPDAGCDLATQIANRRRWAWAEVRRIGHALVAAGRVSRATGDVGAFRRWTGLRRDLDYALRSWAAFRDWSRSLQRAEIATERRQSAR